jgi:hypothetical protein
MEKNATPKGGFWMLVEDLNEALNEIKTAQPEEKSEYLDDEFFPDTSF